MKLLQEHIPSDGLLFPQDRVTDHRLGKTVHGVHEFLEGGERLGDLIGELRALEEAKELARLSREEEGT